jgi:DNA repair protein RadC
MPITDWPNDERPREKLIRQGSGSLSDAELLAIFLRTGTRGKTAVDLARDLLGRAGSLPTLLNLPADQLCQAKGFGMSKYVQLQASLELGRRYLQHRLHHTTVTLFDNAHTTKQFLRLKLAHLERETFACLFLDKQHRLLAFDTLFLGTIDCTHIHPRVIVQHALRYNAAAIIVAHNHPSGCARPSPSDIALTQRLHRILSPLDIRLLDHIVVSLHEANSLVELGEYQPDAIN